MAFRPLCNIVKLLVTWMLKWFAPVSLNPHTRPLIFFLVGIAEKAEMDPRSHQTDA
jgi:hypothetical protein